MEVIGNQAIRFADIEVDPRGGSVRRNGEEVRLRSKSLQVLVYLIEQRDRLVSKEELLQQVWKDTAVTDDVLVQSIVEIRRALGDSSQRPRFVKTIPKAGYRFISSVEEAWANPASGAVVIEEATSFEIEFDREIPDPLPATRAVAGQLIGSPLAQKRHHRLWLIAATSAVLIAAIALAVYFGWQAHKANQPVAEATLTPTAGKLSIAVMYFENQSGQTDMDWLREGLADMLITDLSRSNRFAVLSREQLYLLLDRNGYKPGDKIRLDDALEIARKSHAEAIAIGSFARLGDKIRLNVQLHDSRTGQLLASEALTASRPEDIFAQIDLLSIKLAAHLGITPESQDAQASLSRVMTDNLEAYRYYSLALEKAHGYHSAEAIALWEKAVALDPQFAMAYARIGYTYALVRVNEHARAKPYLERAFQLSSRLSEKDKLYIRAWYAQASRDPDEAVRTFYEIIAHYPQETEAYLRLGFLLTGSQERYAESLRVLEQGVAVDPDAKDLYNQLGFAYHRGGRYDEAITAHLRYVQLAPNEPNAYDSLGMSYNEAGRYDEAIAAFDRALALNADFHFANRHKGDAFFLLGRYRDALGQYERYLQVAPSDWDRAMACNLIARVHLARNEIAKAEAAARQELSYQNDFGGTMLVALARGDLQAAEKLQARWRESGTNPKPALAMDEQTRQYLLGLCALKAGRAEEATAYFKVAQRAAMNYWNIDTTVACLAQAYVALGRTDEAIAEYETLIKVNPNWPMAHYYLARAYEQKGERERAREEYDRFLQIWNRADSDIPEVIAARTQRASLS
jgi:tetratricopeptide (TPR) repeat protein/DNA-binding winged helix-turn-helix (wHTH) protein